MKYKNNLFILIALFLMFNLQWIEYVFILIFAKKKTLLPGSSNSTADELHVLSSDFLVFNSTNAGSDF